MTAAAWAAIASIVGPMLSGLLSSDQERQSFTGTNVSPLRMMNQANSFTNNLGSALAGRVSQGVNLPSAYVQTPGAYTGGGLPMPIGVSAEDPALTNRSLQSLQGLGAFQNLFIPSSGSWYDNPTGTPGAGTVPGGGTTPPDTFDPRTGEPIPGFDDFYQPPFDPRTDENPQGTTDGSEPTPGNSAENSPEIRGTRRRVIPEYGQLVRASDVADDGSGDDMNKALGSVQLLLEAFGGKRAV